MRNRSFCLILVLMLSGLGWAAKDYVFTPEEQGVVTPQLAFDPDQAKQALGPGTCSLKGVAFEERSGSKRPIPTDSTIYLFPYTPYCQEVVKLFREYSVPPLEKSMDEVMLESQCQAMGVKLPEFLPVKRVEVDPRFPKIWRKTKTDKAGNFVFDHLKPGRYYLQSPTFMVAKNEHWKEKVGEDVQEYWWSDGVVTTDYTPVYENRQTMVLHQVELVGVFELNQEGEVRQIELNEDWHDFQAP
ncbi:carboxypeptidase regulatory-like domain-containing protein [bacterium]|nr:carboxypeptidase regulatory-like domain-containing protein [bacterium]